MVIKFPVFILFLIFAQLRLTGLSHGTANAAQSDASGRLLVASRLRPSPHAHSSGQPHAPPQPDSQLQAAQHSRGHHAVHGTQQLVQRRESLELSFAAESLDQHVSDNAIEQPTDQPRREPNQGAREVSQQSAASNEFKKL
jgi:poly-D-alanine transfer protein DltD